MLKRISIKVHSGKDLSVWLEFIDETGERVFCLQMQIKSCLTLLLKQTFS